MAVLTEHPGDDYLSRRDLRIIGEVVEKYKDMPWRRLVDLTHDLPEWEDPKGSSIPITYRQVLEMENISKTTIDDILDTIEHDKALGELLQKVPVA